MYPHPPHSDATRTFVASLVSLVLGLTAFASAFVLSPLAAGPASAASAGPVDITDGSVTWGIKASWRAYIGPAGTDLSGGVTQNADGEFVWPVTSGSFDDATDTLKLSLAGQAHFDGYCTDNVARTGCLLDSTFKDLSLEISPTRQVVVGTYLGIPQSDPGGAQDVYEDVVLAQMDITGVTPSVTGGATTWPALPTVAGPGLQLYAAGTPIDPVSLAYTGPGGAPSLAETFAQPDAPALTPGPTWTSTAKVDTTANTNAAQFTVYGSTAHDVAHVVQYADVAPPGDVNGNYVVKALDDDDLTEQATASVAGGDYGFFRTAYDPATDSVFVLSGNLTGASASDGVGFTVTRLQYDGSGYQQSTVGTFSINGIASPEVDRMQWNPVDGELALIAQTATGTVFADYSLISFTPDGDGGWTTDRQALTIPSTGQFAGSTYLSGPFGFGIGQRDADTGGMGVARDGSYVVTNSGKYGPSTSSLQRLPVFDIGKQGDGSRIVVPIADSLPPDDEWGGSYYQYGAATTAADGSVLLYQDGKQDIAYVDIVDGTAKLVSGPIPLTPSWSVAAGQAAADSAHGVDYVFNQTSSTVSALRAGVPVASWAQADSNILLGKYLLATLDDGSVLVQYKDGSYLGLRKLRFTGVTPAFATQPESQDVSLGTGVDSKTVAFTSTVTGGDPAPTRQWQVKAPGTSRFTDLDGQTGDTLTVTAKPGMDGTQYRALYTNAAGTIASDVATLGVDYAPVIQAQPRSATVTEGTDATYTATYAGDPAPTVTWEYRVKGSSGLWQPIAADDDNFGVSTGEGISTLTVPGANTDQSDLVFRLKAVNSVGTTFSDDVDLTVNPRVTIPAGGLRLSGVTLDWTGSEEIQTAPPFGGSNYLSAGASDGDQASYRASDGDVSVFQVDSTGRRTPATYATRADHVTDGGSQLVELTGGKAELNADGSGEVDWTGAFSVNFYGGLVPFTVTDPELKVDADGTGTLVGDLSGYGSSQADPDQKTRLDPVDDVTIATFSDVELDPTGVVTVDPDYAGVAITVPAGQTVQDTDGAGWGSWPQSWVDFQFDTGLSSYWYSSGGSADADKAPAPFTVDFTGAQASGTSLPAASTTTVSLARSGFAYGQTTTATVHVTTGGAPATGVVTLTTSGHAVSATLAGGSATVTLPAGITTGRHTLNVSYAGIDSPTAPVAPSAGTASFKVTKAQPRVKLELARKKRLKHGRRGTAKVIVTIPGGTGVAATGQVVIRDGGRIIATKALGAGKDGVLRVRLPKLGKGRHWLRAGIGSTALHTTAASPYRHLRVR